MTKHLPATGLLVAAILAASTCAMAQKKYDVGASDTEIKIGNIMPYSGPASAYGVIGKVEEAYFKMINERGGINGRKINFISYDDGYSPPKAVERARTLVESDEVLLIFGSLGTPSNSAIQRYMNDKNVPQLFVATGATKFSDPKQFPWTMGWQANYQSESRVYVKYLLSNKPDAKIAVLYQNDDYGKDMLKGLRDGLGSRAASMIVALEGYEISEQSVRPRIVNLQSSGADVFFSFTTPKFAALALKEVAQVGWSPMYFQSSVGSSVASVLKPAGFENAQGIYSAAFAKDGADSRWASDEGMKRFYSFLAKYAPDANRADGSVVYGYGQAQTIVQVLKQAGDDLTRKNIMRQAANLKYFVPDTLLPGVKINTGPMDFHPIEQLQLMEFKGESWVLKGPVINSDLSGHLPSGNAVSAPVARAPVVSNPPGSANLTSQPPSPTVLPSMRSSKDLNSRRIALVIGNSNYRNVPALVNPQNDAKLVAEALSRSGFNLVTLKMNLDKDSLVSELRAFAQQAETADWSVVYYAGHGMEVGGVNYLIPVDARILTDRDISFEALPLDQVLNAAERAKRLRLVILDACRDNPFANQMKRTMSVASRSVSRGLTTVEPEAGTLVVYAAKDGEIALDGNGTNSPFALAFVKNLQTPGLEVRRMFDFVRDDVMDVTQRRQKPFSYGSISGRDDFYFVSAK